jgi:hypothetical protein
MLFGVNPFGVQREGLTCLEFQEDHLVDPDLIFPGIIEWFSEAKRYDGYWTAEMAIPFKTLTLQGRIYQHGRQISMLMTAKQPGRSHGIIFREIRRIFSVAFSGDLIFDEPLPKPGANISIIPYVYWIGF